MSDTSMKVARTPGNVQRLSSTESAGATSDKKSGLRGKPYDEQVQMLAPEPSAAAQAALVLFTAEIKRLAIRAPQGIEPCYQKILALGLSPKAEVHYLGAQAARAAGNVSEQQVRLQLAKAGGMDVDGELEAIEQAYGTVRIGPADEKKKKKRKKDEVGPELVAAEMPFAPDLRRAIEAAQESLRSTGAFSGFLPAGAYTLGDKSIQVISGQTAQISY